MSHILLICRILLFTRLGRSTDLCMFFVAAFYLVQGCSQVFLMPGTRIKLIFTWCLYPCSYYTEIVLLLKLIFCYLFWKLQSNWAIILICKVFSRHLSLMNANFFRLSVNRCAVNSFCKNRFSFNCSELPLERALGLDVLIPCNEGNIHSDFRKGLLKYPQNKRKHEFVITRITLD